MAFYKTYTDFDLILPYIDTFYFILFYFKFSTKIGSQKKTSITQESKWQYKNLVTPKHLQIILLFFSVLLHRRYILLRYMDWQWEYVTWSQHTVARGEISIDKSVLKLLLHSVSSVPIFYWTGNMQSAILLSFIASFSLPPCGLQSTHPRMPCYISPYVVYNVYGTVTEIFAKVWMFHKCVSVT